MAEESDDAASHQNELNENFVEALNDREFDDDRPWLRHNERDDDEYEEEEEEEERVDDFQIESDAFIVTVDDDTTVERRPWLEIPRKESAIYEEEEEEEGEERSEVTIAAGPPRLLEEEVSETLETDHVLVEIPAEVLASREAMLAKAKLTLQEQPRLQKKNRLLELFVVRHMKKTQRKLIPLDGTVKPEEMELIYRGALVAYKLLLDKIMARQEHLQLDMRNYEKRVQEMREEEERTFNDLIAREKEIATDLIYAKTGKTVTDRAIEQFSKRQKDRRRILSRDRFVYIVLQHRLKDLDIKLRKVETLGKGMTTMDYEALRIANVNNVDKLDERNRELEKFRTKVAEMINAVAHMKEKENCVEENTEVVRKELAIHRAKINETREEANAVHAELDELRREYNERKSEAGLLVARAELREMERMMILRDSLYVEIKTIEGKVRQFDFQERNKMGGKKKGLSAISTLNITKCERVSFAPGRD